jgi:hypothetical protein
MNVNVICRNYKDERVIPRFVRYLRDCLGWSLTNKPDGDADAYYLSGYFEESYLRPWPDKPVGAYFTHRETEPPDNAKAKQFDRMSKRVDMRVATAVMYAEMLVKDGPTALMTPPVERDRFTIPKQRNGKMIAGFSGFTYPNKRKGEDMVRSVVNSKPGSLVGWRASGRGWPVPTKKYPWAEMPAFYQSLDILVITSRVEGVPMPPLECLSCGVSVVIPRGVGLLDELPDLPGIHRYQTGNAKECVRALSEAIDARGQVDRQALRNATRPYNITAWCEQHRQAFEELLFWRKIEESTALPLEIPLEPALCA